MRRLLITLTCVGAMANADTAALAADALGPLFFTPAQRTQLDAVRARSARQPIEVETEQEAPRGPDVLTYSGVVRPSEGRSTVWINGKPIIERTRNNDVNVLGVRRDGAVSVTAPQSDRPASLRVGQSVDVTSGTIEEPYARRATAYSAPVVSAPSVPVVTDTKAKPPASAAAPTATDRRAARRDAKESDPDSGAAPPAERGSRAGK